MLVAERGDLPRHHVHELAVQPARRVDPLEVLERRDERRVDLERAIEVHDRLVGLAHVRVEQLAELAQDLFAVEISDGDVECPRERRTELLPVRVLPVQLPHLPQGADVVRIELDDLRVVGLRVLGVAEVVAVPLGEVQAEPDLLLRLGLLLQPLVRGLDDLAPAPRRLRHPLEVLRRLAIVEVLAERVDERVERLVLVLELLLEHARDLSEKIRALGRLRPRLEAG